MSNLISKKIRGFRDILPQESKKFLHIEKIIHYIVPLFNTHQVRLPALESVDLFKRSIGETASISSNPSASKMSAFLGIL